MGGVDGVAGIDPTTGDVTYEGLSASLGLGASVVPVDAHGGVTAGFNLFDSLKLIFGGKGCP